MSVITEPGVSCPDGMLSIPVRAVRAGEPVTWALVDEADGLLVGKRKWFLSTTSYALSRASAAERSAGFPVHIAMHRLVLDVHLRLDGLARAEVDHINRNRLDNRRSNLRIVTRSMNNYNQTKRIGLTSQYIGVSFHAASGLYRGTIMVSRRQYCTRYFRDEISAAEARDRLSQELLGANARLNFPELGK